MSGERIGMRFPAGDRPTHGAPGGVECGDCGCIFIGEAWHRRCRVCENNFSERAEALLRALVDGLGKTTWSSWQATHHFDHALQQASEFLDEHA